jgi:hypothetical protein
MDWEAWLRVLDDVRVMNKYTVLTDLKFIAAQAITHVCIGTIKRVNTLKDDYLAWELHNVAGLYMRSPTEGWKPPLDWLCWAQAREAKKR